MMRGGGELYEPIFFVGRGGRGGGFFAVRVCPAALFFMTKFRRVQARAIFRGSTFPDVLCRDEQVVGRSERAVADLFAGARAAAPCVLFLDQVSCHRPALPRVPTNEMQSIARRTRC